MKALGVFLIGALAVAGGIAAATYITKKKLEKENEDDYYENWDNVDDAEDDWDFDFDDDVDVEETAETVVDKAAEAVSEAASVIKETVSDPFRIDDSDNDIL